MASIIKDKNNSGCGGCLAVCFSNQEESNPPGESADNTQRAGSIVPMRVNRPYWKEILRFMNFMLTNLRLPPQNSKSIIIYALFYLEKLILKSQENSSKGPLL